MIEQRLERIWLQIKGMKMMFLVPLVGYFVLIPLMVWILFVNSEVPLEDAAASVCYLLVPILSTWWVCMIQKEYIEGEGREVLLLGKGVLYSMAAFWLLNLVCFVVILLFLDTGIRYEFSALVTDMVIVSFLMTGMACCLNFYTKSITISMFVIVFYTAFSNYKFYNESIVKLVGAFQLTVLQEIKYEIGWYGYIRYILAGILLWGFGIYKSKHFE